MPFFDISKKGTRFFDYAKTAPTLLLHHFPLFFHFVFWPAFLFLNNLFKHMI